MFVWSVIVFRFMLYKYFMKCITFKTIITFISFIKLIIFIMRGQIIDIFNLVGYRK